MQKRNLNRSAHRRAGFALPLFAFALFFAGDACAYLDPGTGSILLQGMIAAVAAVATWGSLRWQHAKAWLHARMHRMPPGGGDSGTSD